MLLINISFYSEIKAGCQSMAYILLTDHLICIFFFKCCQKHRISAKNKTNGDDLHLADQRSGSEKKNRNKIEKY